MSKKKQENELSDLVSLNEEMQTIWSEKESEFREMLERFSAYRDAVEADSKEKDEIFAEEIGKREIIIRELEISRKNLEGELRKKDGALERMIRNTQQLDVARLHEFQEIDTLVSDLAGKCAETGPKVACHEINTRLQSIITELEQLDYSIYLINYDYTVQEDFLGSDFSNSTDSRTASGVSGDTFCTADAPEKEIGGLMLLTGNLNSREQQLTTPKEVKTVEKPSEDISKNVEIFTGQHEEFLLQKQTQDNSPNFRQEVEMVSHSYQGVEDAGAHELPPEQHEGFHSVAEDEIQVNTPNVSLENGIVSDPSYSVPEAIVCNLPRDDTQEDLAKLVKQIEEDGIDCERNRSDEEEHSKHSNIERKTVVRLLDEQWTRYQLVCKEKDDEIQHWRKKHKQDTKDLQDLLEEQERAEIKNNETITVLHAEVDKLQQRNKFLESEVEMTKEEGQDEVCILRESYQRNLSDQLRRQSQTILSVEEASRFKLAELETKNEELERVNDDLRRQISDHCTEIRSWVTGILLLTEEEYNEEFHTISDVLGKLQEIILEKKRIIDELQSQLNEHKESVKNEPRSPNEDTLSHSLGGFSWNSADFQKDVCRNCKQAKWRRVLMGSFDFVEAEGLDVKQDEVERFVAKIDLSDSKYRKKQSLMDSLELADPQVELLQPLGEQNFNSLDTLVENNLEGKSNIPSFGLTASHSVSHGEEIVEGEMVPLFDLVDGAIPDKNPNGVYQVSDDGVDFDVLSQDRILSTTEQVDSLCNDSEDYNEYIKLIGEDGDEDIGDDDDDDNAYDNDSVDDVVHVVNLYRSLVVENADSHVEAKNATNDGQNGIISFTDLVSPGDVTKPDDVINWVAMPNDDVTDDDRTRCSTVTADDDITDLNRVTNGELAHDHRMEICVNQGRPKNPKDTTTLIPRIIISTEEDDSERICEKWDWNNNFFDKDSNVEAHSKQNRSVPSIESGLQNDSTDVETAPEKSSKCDLDFNETHRTNNENPESMKVNMDCEKIRDVLSRNLRNENLVSKSCLHCSEILTQQAMNYEKTIEKILELRSQQAKNDELRVLRELEEAKADVSRFQREYEELEKVCKDYRKRIDEYSENVREKNSELRRLKLSSGIMKTEVEWLRQALGITRNYADLTEGY